MFHLNEGMVYLPVLMLQWIKSHVLRHTEAGNISSRTSEAHSVAWHVHHNFRMDEKK